MYSVVLLMAGNGTRMKQSKNKMMLKLDNKYIYEYALETFKVFNLPIILVVNEADYDELKNLKDVTIVLGGATRSESVHNGLLACKTDRVLIHDGARAFVSKDIIKRCIESKARAFYVGVPLKDTIRYKDSTKALDRDRLISVQTPQGGDISLFRDNYTEGKSYFDDIEAISEYEASAECILGDEMNFKITTPFDLELAKLYLNKNKE